MAAEGDREPVEHPELVVDVGSSSADLVAGGEVGTAEDAEVGGIAPNGERDLENEARESTEIGNLRSKAGGSVRKKRFVFNAKADIALLREVLTERPFDKEYGRMRDSWKTIGTKLQNYQVFVDDRGARDRYFFLLKTYDTKERHALRRLGTEEEYEEKERLLGLVTEQVREVKRSRGDDGRDEHRGGDAYESHIGALKRMAESDEESAEEHRHKKQKRDHMLLEIKSELVRLESLRLAADKDRQEADLAARELDRKEREQDRLLREKQLEFERERSERDVLERLEQRKNDEKKTEALLKIIQTLAEALPRNVCEKLDLPAEEQ